MTISRAQMRRQLYMGGGIASLEPRQQYGLGSIVKSVKKAVKGVGDAVGDIVSSDAGKLALLAAGAYYAPALLSGGALSPGLTGYTSGFGAIKNIALSKLPQTALGKGAAILGGSALMTSLFGSPDQAQEAFNRDPGYVKSALAKYYKNINEDASEEEVQNFVNQNILEFGDVSRSDVVSGYEKNIQSNLGDTMYAAEGGRVGLANGGLNTFGLYQNYLNELQDAQQQSMSSPLYNPTVSYQTDGGDGGLTGPTNTNTNISGYTPTLMDLAITAINPLGGIANMASKSSTGLGLGARLADALGIGRYGGKKTGFGVDDVNEDSVAPDASAGGAAGAAAASAAGANDDASTGGPFAEGGRVMKEMGGIMDIPMGEPRLNQQGVKELDYRQEGGFVPVGIKEKADDVPAMLSKNEFVMTADAVRGMGNGSIENGAQKMYNLMKSLENRIA